MSSHIFLSYVRENADQIESLASELESFGLQVWIDRKNLTPGERWRDAIQRAIRAGDLFVACFSQAYSQRERSHMNEELTLAIEELRCRPADRAWFIPVTLDAAEVPDRSIGAGESLRDLQWVNLATDWSLGVARLASVAGAAHAQGVRQTPAVGASVCSVMRAPDLAARRIAILKLKNFMNSPRLPRHSWKKMFVTIDSECQNLSTHQIVDRMFAAVKGDDLVLYLQTVKHMYQLGPHEEELRREFDAVCVAFGVEPDRLR